MSKLSIRLRMGFGLGDMAGHAIVAAMGAFLLFYYTQVLGLDGALTGVALGIAIAWDAFSDPLVGAISDRWRSALGRRHPFMWASTVPLAASFYLLFNPIDGLSERGLFLWLVTMAILTRTFMTLYSIPHQALGAELSTDYEERTRLVNVSNGMGVAGAGLFMGLAYLVVFAPTPEFDNGMFNPVAYDQLGQLGAALVIVCIMISAASTQRAAIRVASVLPPTENKFSFGRLATDGRQTLTNRNFRILMFGALFGGMLGGVTGATFVHVMTYFWGFLPEHMMYVMVAGALCSVVGFRLVHTHLAKIEKKQALIWTSGMIAVIPAITIGLRLLDWLPENGSTALYPIVAFYTAIYSTGLAVKGTLYRSMIADIVDEHELVTGTRQEGLFFSANFFANKATAGFGTVVGGFILTLIEFPSDVTLETVPPEALVKLGLIIGPAFGLLFLIPVAAYSLYQLDRESLAEIQDQLRARPRAVVDESETGAPASLAHGIIAESGSTRAS